MHTGDRGFRDQEMNITFKYIASCEAKILKLDYNKFPNIIKFISTIRFTHLIDLYLGDNTIFSIESICCIEMPELQSLHLNDNPITCIASLRKCFIPKIQYISLRDTRIAFEGQIEPLCQMNCPRLSKIIMNYMDYNFLEQNRGWLNKGNWITRWRNRQKQKDGLKKKY